MEIDEKLLAAQHKKWRGQMLKGLLEFRVLSFIVSEGETHGYQVLQSVKKSLPLTKNIADAPIYGVLNRLQREGVLKVEIRVVENRRRKYFSLTAFGRMFYELIRTDWENICGHNSISA